MYTIEKAGWGEAPGSDGIGGRRAEGGAALLDRHDRAGLTGALDRRIRSDLVGCRAAGIRNKADAQRRRHRIQYEAQRRRYGIAGQVGLGSSQCVRAIGKPGWRIAPHARTVGGRRAEGDAALLDRHQRAGLTGALDRRVRRDLVGCRTAGIRGQPNRECGLGPRMRRVEWRLSRQELIASLRIGAGGDLAGGQPEEFVVGDLRYSGCRVPHGEGGTRTQDH